MKVEMKHLIIPFSILGIGIVLSLVVFICEICLSFCKYGYYTPLGFYLYTSDKRTAATVQNLRNEMANQNVVPINSVSDYDSQ